MPDPDPAIDPALVRGWLAARSVSRGLPAPVADHGGWRVDTGGEDEHRRYVFAAAGAGLVDLVNGIDAPRIFVKLCADEATLRALVPPRWSVLPANCMMVRDGPASAATLPAGYRMTVDTNGSVTRVDLIAADGSLAARGYAAESDGVFAYDRIVTEEAHRRRGLGRVVMATLAAARRDAASREVLTATPMGRALYETIGWQVYAPYTTAVIPDR
ncbi:MULTISPECIES: GNAT family N-acetyltransferase [unclassified Sphingomonas]|jgi:GNAT superfamily N-acetyltransferase|uniref:GNAT family N-acetyltransferase n=1 Tax=unclassified Sphingomonas TaxID=196159 RepID=UPI000E105B44|nr:MULTISPECIES: GNAT family N-acetyltransferase [unclassified Sphingomonas]AXJ94730.1 N-acetyltransferase [Sphingomonas sp. FARSPH]